MVNIGWLLNVQVNKRKRYGMSDDKKKTVAITVYDEDFDAGARAVFEAAVNKHAEFMGYSDITKARGSFLFSRLYDYCAGVLTEGAAMKIDEAAMEEERRRNESLIAPSNPGDNF